MKIIGSGNFPLDYGGVEFNLVKPAGVNRAMDEKKSGVPALEALNCRQATMRGAVIDDPEDAASVIVGRPGHDLINEPVKGGDSRTSFTAAEDFGTVDIKSSQVGPGSTSFVFVFNLHRRFRLRRQSRVKSPSCLNTGFLIGGKDEFVILKRLSAPDAFIQVQDASGFQSEIRITRKDPCAVLTQGRIASACSHRHTVLSLILATSPDWRTSFPSSLTLPNGKAERHT